MLVLGICSNHRSFLISTELRPFRVWINAVVNPLSAGIRNGEIAIGTGERDIWVMELCFSPELLAYELVNNFAISLIS